MFLYDWFYSVLAALGKANKKKLEVKNNFLIIGFHIQ